MTTTRKLIASTIFALCAGAALATPSVDKLTLSPASGAKAGDKVTATVDFANAGDGICGIELEFGDGTREVFKIKPETKLPIVMEHTYAKAGDYKVRAAGTKVENAFACTGKQSVQYQVAAGAAAAGGAANPCPADWSLKGKAAKNGSFTCVPAKGVKDAKKPEKGIDCPAGTSYFTKGKTLGCEVAK